MKRMVSFMLAVLLLCAAMPFAYAEEAVKPPVDEVTESGDTGIMPMAEETEWYFKTINGVEYKRLWSVTYGKWLTDWIPC